MRKNIVVKQSGYKDCAVACLLSIVRYYNGEISKEELSYLIKTDEHGTSAYHMIEGMKKIGFNGYGVKVSKEDICNNTNNLPFIAHILTNNMYHYIVIYEINSKKKYLKVMDPAFGSKKISFDEFKSLYLETILVFYPVNHIPSFKNKKSLWEFLINYILLKKTTLKYLVILSILVMIFTIISSMYFKIVIDYILLDFNINTLIITSIIFLIFIFLKNILNLIRGKLLLEVNNFISKSITIDVIRHIFCLPYQYFKTKPTGEVTSRINELNSFKDLLSNLFLSLFIDLFLILISMIVLFVINKTLLLFSLIIVVLYIIIVISYSNIFKKKIYFIKGEEGEYSKDLTEALENYESIKNLNLISNIIYKLEVKYIGLMSKLNNFQNSLFKQSFLKNLVVDLGNLIVICLGTYFVYNKVITLGDLVAFNTLLMFFLEPIKQLLDLEPDLRIVKTSYERINDILVMNTEENNSLINMDIYGDITINNLSYSYNDVDYIFKNINLKIKKYDKLLIYGNSGSGKSTLIKILLGYAKNYSGKIIINNINHLDISCNIIKNTFTYVSQKEKLFSNTLENNIVMGRNIGLKEYEDILRLSRVNIIRDNKKLRNMFWIDENGFNLSGGERQKIILARALLKKSNYLILDEALSEVGVEEEKLIIKGILNRYKDKTIIYISHKNEIINMFENKYRFYQKGELC